MLENLKKAFQRLFGGTASLEDTEFQAEKSKKGQAVDEFAVAERKRPIYKRRNFLRGVLIVSFVTSFFFVVLPKLTYVLNNREQSVIRKIQQEEFVKKQQNKS